MERVKSSWDQLRNSRLWCITRQHFKESDFLMTSIVAAYYFLLSLFPLMIAIGNILPYLNLNPERFLMFIKRAMPVNIYQILDDLIKGMLTKKSGSLLSISAIITLWSASRGINALQQGINRAYGVGKERNVVFARILSFLVLLLLIFVSALSVVILGFGQELVSFLRKKFSFDWQILNNVHSISLIMLALFIFLIIFVLYYAVANIVIPKMRFVLPGAFLATLGLLLLSQLFGIYANYFSHNLSEYQVIGSFIVLMFWLVFCSRIVILGSMINAIMMEYFGKIKPQERDQVMNEWMKQKTAKELAKFHSNRQKKSGNRMNKK